MRRPRIYTSSELRAGSRVILESRNNHYLINVLRVKVGAEVVLFDGSGFDFSGVVAAVDKKSVAVDLIGEPSSIGNESPLHTTLAIAISKGDRMDWVVQKATELGVTEIQPLFTQRVDVKLSGDRSSKKQAHWHATAISACEQCGRSVLPRMHSVCSIENWLDDCTESADTLSLVLAAGGESLAAIKSGRIDAVRRATVLIGPEGGLTEQELALAEAKGFFVLGFGQRTLRTETAPIVALTALQSAWGDYM